jgi:hypothetical protein
MKRHKEQQPSKKPNITFAASPTLSYTFFQNQFSIPPR